MAHFQFQVQRLSTLSSRNFMPLVSCNHLPRFVSLTKSPNSCTLSASLLPTGPVRFPCHSFSSGTAIRYRTVFRMSGSDMISQMELGKPEDRQKREKRVNGIFWIILLNLGVYVADHFFQVRGVKSLYLYHNWPAWYQFVTATFCHANWNHLSSNLFFLYIFGKLVEEEGGAFGLWLSYIFTGVGANIISWLILPRNAVSVGASGAVFGLFAMSVLVKMSWDWRKILEVLILGQFVIERVMEAAQASAGLSSTLQGSSALQSINHIAHLSGALVSVVLVWLLSKFPSENADKELPDFQRKRNKSS
ncbi:rhomboid-like protein 11, chloroplastic isoform X1 [Carica papaya]|uniref:rhomboid-like protein 11, chloroplastic isoform X1 n=3 Tax=Carica papaya TaxID=3649 RepID=UPI000B8CB088|nr:rhomboid-like protein 11, chloroplastic isoform X1 [Carica papaya]